MYFLQGQFEMTQVLYGTAEGGHFGYAIASGDLDADGFDGNPNLFISNGVGFRRICFLIAIDIIVGSPWENDGVIYVFNGGSDYLEVSERIEAAKFLLRPSQKIQRFGFSISKPVDIDANGLVKLTIRYLNLFDQYRSNNLLRADIWISQLEHTNQDTL